MIKILHLEDSRTDIELIDRLLRKSDIPFDKKVVSDKTSFEAALKTFAPDIVLADHSLPSFNSFEALEILRNLDISIPFILITAFISEDFAVTVMKAGAWDFILKDRLQRLPSAILNALAKDLAEKENKEYLRQVVASEKLLKEAQRMAGIGSWQLDWPDINLVLSDEAYRIFGISDDQRDKFHTFVLNLIHPDDLAFARELFRISISEKIPYDTSFRVILKDGTLKYLHVKSEVYPNGADDKVRSIGTVQDITARTMAEQAIRASESKLEIKNKELERKNKELEQFAYVSSHDLQEPLATIASFAGLLQQEYIGKLDEQADRSLTFIAQSAGRMKTLIKDLLDYSRIGVGMILGEVDCNNVLVEALEDLGKPVRDTKAMIHIGPLPVVTGYRSGLRQLFQNLISNGIKFRKPDHFPEIYISAEPAAEGWEFSFRDNGIGIDPIYHEKIFIIFQRLHDRSEYEGSGIGLSHCKKIVELHKGRIRVESSVGQGSTFYFTIQRDLKE